MKQQKISIIIIFFTKLSLLLYRQWRFCGKKLIFYCLIVLVFFLIFFHSSLPFLLLTSSSQPNLTELFKDWIYSKIFAFYWLSVRRNVIQRSYWSNHQVVRMKHWNFDPELFHFVFECRTGIPDSNFQLASILYHIQYLKRSIPSHSNLLNSMREKRTGH